MNESLISPLLQDQEIRPLETQSDDEDDDNRDRQKLKSFSESELPESMEMKKENDLLTRLAAGRRRDTVAVGISLAVILLLTATPIAFYIWKPTSQKVSNSLTASYQCNQSLPFNFLKSSVCSSYLAWMQQDTDVNRNITVEQTWPSYCTEKKLEQQLKSLFSLTLGYRDSNCAERAKALLCHSVYRPCQKMNCLIQETRNDCVSFREEDCPAAWREAEDFLAATASELFCFSMPNCNKFPENVSCGPTESPITILDPGKISHNSFQNNSCPPPLISSQYAKNCSPECFADDWSKTALDVTLYGSLTFNWICIIVLLITWIALPALIKFPHTILFFMSISYALTMAGLSLTVFVGRQKAFCNYPDALSVQEDPSNVCRVQGILVHFGVVSTVLWWLCSIFNVLVAVYSIYNPVLAYFKMFLALEVLFSVAIPGLLVGVVLWTKGHYTATNIEVITCTPPTVDLLYFTLSLPLQIAFFLGTAMAIFIIKKLRQSRTLRRKNPCSVSKVYQSLQQRFLFLVILCPFSFCVIMTSIGIHGRFSKHNLDEYHKYFLLCLKDRSNCDSPPSKYHSAMFAITELLMLCLFNFALTAYILAPRLARDFWRSRLASVKKALRCLVLTPPVSPPESGV